MAAEVYLALKLVHILAASLLLGNWATLLIWKASADRSGDPAAVAIVADRVFRIDRKVSGPAAIVAFATGYFIIRPLGEFGGRIGANGWAVWGLVLFFVAVLAWYFGMRPLEARLADLADAARERNEAAGEDYRRATVLWLLFDAVALAAGIAAAFMMIAKPTVWPS